MGLGAGAAAAIGAVGSVAGGLISAGGAKSAADVQAAAARQAADLQQQRYLQTRSDLSPYNQTGQANLGPLGNFYQGTQGQLDTAFNNAQGAIPQIPTQATLLQMPGYQFNLDQGLKAVQSQETARGLGLSGAATKAASNYATGLASNYLGQYFGMGQQQYQDQSQQFANATNRANTVYNQLYGPAALGENAAAQTGNTGATLATNAGNSLMAAGQAQAAGIGTAAGSISQGLQGATGNALLYSMLNNQNGGNSGPGLFTGVGNLLNGYAWNGMSTGSNLSGLTDQANLNVANGGGAI